MRDGDWPDEVNVIELICSSFGNEAWYESLASQIASHLGWSVFNEHEDRPVYPAED